MCMSLLWAISSQEFVYHGIGVPSNHEAALAISVGYQVVILKLDVYREIDYIGIFYVLEEG